MKLHTCIHCIWVEFTIWQVDSSPLLWPFAASCLILHIHYPILILRTFVPWAAPFPPALPRAHFELKDFLYGDLISHIFLSLRWFRLSPGDSTVLYLNRILSSQLIMLYWLEFDIYKLDWNNDLWIHITFFGHAHMVPYSLLYRAFLGLWSLYPILLFPLSQSWSYSPFKNDLIHPLKLILFTL